MHHVTQLLCFMSGDKDVPCDTVGVVVQWLDYMAVTQEPGVRFPATAEKYVRSDISCGAALVDMG